MSHAIAPLPATAPADRPHTVAAAGAGSGEGVFPAFMAAAARVGKPAVPGTAVEPADPRLEAADASLLLDGVLAQLGIAPAAAPLATDLPGLPGASAHAATALTAGPAEALDARPVLPTDPLAQAIAQAHADAGALDAATGAVDGNAAGAITNGAGLPLHSAEAAGANALAAEPQWFAGHPQNQPAAAAVASAEAAPPAAPAATPVSAGPTPLAAATPAGSAPATSAASAIDPAGRHGAAAPPPQPAPTPAEAPLSATVAAATIAPTASREPVDAIDGLAPPAPDALQAAFSASDTRVAAAPARLSPLLPPVAMPADPEAGFDTALASRIGWMADQGIGHARIRITPEHLGTIDLQLRVEGDKVSAEFQSAHADVRHALEAGLNRLRDQLAEHGLQLGRAHVGDGRNGGDGESRDGSRAPGRMAAITGATDGAGDEPAGLPDGAAARRGLVDEYV